MSYKIVFNFLSSKERDYLKRFTSRLQWEPGRQGTGYDKANLNKANLTASENELIKIFQARSKQLLKIDATDEGFDNYILRYQKGSYIPTHKDDAPFGSEHWRLNALIDSGVGGLLTINGRDVGWHEGDACIFRPDQWEHSVSPVFSDVRYVWSFGVLK